MSKFVFKDAKIIYGGRDLSGELSQVGIDYSADTPERTAFGDGTRRRLPGVLDIAVSHQGFWDSIDATDSLDKDLFDKIGAASELISFSPDGGQDGEIGFSFNCQAANYSPGASHGEVFAFNLTVNADGPLIRGIMLGNAAIVGTTQGDAKQIGAALATETIYSTLHVTAVSGTLPTLDVTVVSDDADGDPFGSGLLRLTHPQMTAVGANRQTLVGAVTDDWYRMIFTIGGSDTPTFTVFGVVGIQTTLL